MNKAIMIVLLLVFAMLFFGCLETKSRTQQETKSTVIEECINLCIDAKNKGIDLKQGPCLSDILEWRIENYVCDVAHWPRTDNDNLKVNQCKAYGITAMHFIEVDSNCNFIRSA